MAIVSNASWRDCESVSEIVEYLNEKCKEWHTELDSISIQIFLLEFQRQMPNDYNDVHLPEEAREEIYISSMMMSDCHFERDAGKIHTQAKKTAITVTRLIQTVEES